MTLEVTQVPPASGTADSGQMVWAGFKIKAEGGDRYETVSMTITQASNLVSNLQDAITRAHKERGGVPATETA